MAVLCADPIPSRYDYMDIGLYTGQFTPGYTVAVDVAGIQLFGDSIAEYTRRIDMCIDHHPSNSGYADCMLLDGDAAATAEIIYELLTAIGTEITPTIADCLYTGLSTGYRLLQVCQYHGPHPRDRGKAHHRGRKPR